MLIGIIVLVILIMLSAFFSGSESAFLSIGEFKIRHMVEKKKKNSLLIEKLKNDSHRLLTTILIANNVLNLSASAIAAKMALDYFGEIGPAISTGILTFVILIFGEISPKAIATRNSEKFAQFAAKPLKFSITLLFPLVIIFENLTKHLVKDATEAPKMSEEELKSIIKFGEEEGSIDKEEKEMIHNIIELDDIMVHEIMTPRNMMFSLNKDLTLSEALPEIKEMMHSRIPVYDKDNDHIVGILHVKDLIKELDNLDLNQNIEEFCKTALFIPETQKVRVLLNKFKKEKTHMAMVINEYGGVAGVVTIEDILEEIVGEIYDETDDVEVMIKFLNSNTARVDGSAEFDEVNKRLSLKIKDKVDDNFETISGYIMQNLGRIPENGEKLEFDKFFCEIEKVDGQRIELIKVIKK